MALSVDNLYSSLMNSGTGTSAATSSALLSSTDKASGLSASGLQQSIQGAQTDEEMMDACKEFESYFLEQIYKGMQATVEKEDEEDDYTSMFGDMLTKEYASATVKNQGTGLAQMLYESMKRNSAAAVASAPADQAAE